MMKQNIYPYAKSVLGFAVAFLVLYGVCDRLAQIQPLSLSSVLESCQRDAAGLCTSVPHPEPPQNPSEVSWNVTFANVLEKGSSALPHRSGLVEGKICASNGKTGPFLETQNEKH